MVAQVRRMSGIKKVGHAGTLDPEAEGLLIVLVGKEFTKKADAFLKLDKTYEFTLKLGYTSTTGDEEGHISRTSRITASNTPGCSHRRFTTAPSQASSSPGTASKCEICGSREVTITGTKPSKTAILAVLTGLEGQISQTPPIYSAIKIGGQRAYKLAHKGETPTMRPRQVTIHKIDLISYDYPHLKLCADVSSGTYIRSLGETIGEQLATGAYCTEIVRTQIGKYSLKDAIDLDKA